MRTKRFLGNIGFYFMGSFATKIIQFLFIPFYTKFIDTSEFGYFGLVLSVVSLGLPVLYQSIWEGVLRFAIEKEGDEYKVINTTTIYCLGLTLLYSLIFITFSLIFHFQYSYLILIMGISQMASTYWQFSSRALKANKIYALSTVISSIVTIVVNIILIIVLRWGLVALFVANIAGQMSMVVIMELKIHLLNRLSKSNFDKILLKSILKYSIPLAVNAISWWLISSSNNLIITYYFGIGANGVFSMASRFGALLSIITLVINMAWLEESFRIHSDSDKDAYFNYVLEMITRVIFSAVIILIPTTFIIYKYFVFGEYKAGVILTSVLYVGAAYAAIAGHLGSAFLARKESRLLFRTTLIGGLFAIISAVIISNFAGFVWAVIASTFGFVIMFFIRIPLLYKRMEIKINYALTIGMTILSVILSIICNVKADSLLSLTLVLISTIFIALIINMTIIKYIYYKYITKGAN